MSLAANPTVGAGLCVRCRVRVYRFVLGGEAKCIPCTLRHAPMLRRSLYTALVVGTILTAINQGNILLDGAFPAALAWKIPLTYCVPFCVATWGALINSRAPHAPVDSTANSTGEVVADDLSDLGST